MQPLITTMLGYQMIVIPEVGEGSVVCEGIQDLRHPSIIESALVESDINENDNMDLKMCMYN